MAITQKYLGEPAANLYLFHSEGNENEHPETGQTLAEAVYTGVENMVNEILSANPFFQYTVGKFVIIPLARTMAEVPTQSLVEDKTQRQSALYADVTDDLHPTLVINSAVPTGVESVEDEASRAIKYILNGQLFIQKGEQIYTPQGQRVGR